MIAAARILRAIREACADGPRALPTPEIAKAAGVDKRTVLRLLPHLEEEGFFTRTGAERSVATFQLVTNAVPERGLSPAEKHAIGRDDEDPPGTEYTPIVDPAAARADRVRAFRARGWHGMADRLEATCSPSF